MSTQKKENSASKKTSASKNSKTKTTERSDVNNDVGQE
jgi:hypothetical protein